MLVKKNLLMNRLQKRLFLLYFNLFGRLPRNDFVDVLYFVFYGNCELYVHSMEITHSPFEANGMS